MPADSLPDPSADPPLLFGRVRYEVAFGIALLVSLLFRLSYTSLIPLIGDELMHWQWARHPALGYPEHPPLIAWLIAVVTAVLGSSQLAVRLTSVVAVTCAFLFAFRLARELFNVRAAFFGVVPLC